MKKVPIPTLLIALTLAIIFGVYLFTFQVRFSEVAIKLRLGQADESSVIDKPGLWPKWPYPIETVRKFDARVRTLETPEDEIKTRDGKNVIIGCYALWRIVDPLQYFKSAPNELETINQIKARLYQAQAAVIGRRDMTDFVNLDDDALAESYAGIERDLMAEAGDTIKRDYGVQIEQFKLRRISLPQQATERVFEQMRSEREVIATQFRQEGQSTAERIKAQAQADADKIKVFAERYAKEIASQGIRQSTKILAQIQEQDSEFYVWLQRLEAMKQGLAKGSTFWFDADSPMFRVLTQPAVPRDAAPAANATAEQARKP